LTSQTKQTNVEHYPDRSASKIQNAIDVLSDMETKLNEVSGQVADMKKRLASFAETEAEKAKGEVIDQANAEAQQALDQLRQSAQSEADAIIAKGMKDTNELAAKISSKVSDAVDLIVNAVQSV
jgi:vacuolar-type H+-ATPase subunit H